MGHLYEQWKKGRRSRLDSHAQLDIYLGTANGLYRVYLPNANFFVLFEHVVLKKWGSKYEIPKYQAFLTWSVT